MSSKHFKLELITPDKVVFSSKAVVSAVLPGSEGYFGVLANHAPLVSKLAMGELDVTMEDGTLHSIAICDGFAEVVDNQVTVLAESAEDACNIDLARAEQARMRAEERIASHDPKIDMDRAQAALARAINRIKVAGRG